MDKKQKLVQWLLEGKTESEIKQLLIEQYPEEFIEPSPAPDAAATTKTKDLQGFLDRTLDAITKINNSIAVHDLMSLQSGQEIYEHVKVNKFYLMSVDKNSQYLMQGLCISKANGQATFVGYSWNTKLKHVNTVWAVASQSNSDPENEKLTFNGANINDLKSDDNALANVALVKSFVPSGIKGSTITFEDGTTLVL